MPMTPTPYKPYRPEDESANKRYAGLQGNITQGKTGEGTFRALAASTLNPPAQQPPVIPRPENVSTLPFQYTTPSYYGGKGLAGEILSSYTNPIYYAPPAKVPKMADYEKAIADAPEQYKDIAKWVLDAYRIYLGREADEPGYLSWYAKAVQERGAGRPVSWETIANWIRESEEGRHYQVAQDVGLAIEPELLSAEQAYRRWLLENELQRELLGQQLEQRRGAYQADYQTAIEDLARQMAEQRREQQLLAARRGLYHSGILDAALKRLAEQEALAQARMGSEFARNLANLEQTYGTNIGQLAARAALYGQQYNEQLAELMRRREGLIQQALAKALEDWQEEQWRQKMYDWEREKFFTNLAFQKALASRYGGGGGGYGGGGSSGAYYSEQYFPQIMQQARLMALQAKPGETPEDVAANVTSILLEKAGGGRPGLNLNVPAGAILDWLETVGPALPSILKQSIPPAPANAMYRLRKAQ